MTMNTPVQNADDVAKLVFAVVLNSARNSFDGTKGMIADDPLHEERVITVRKKPNLHLDTRSCLPARDTTCACDGRDQGSHQRGIAPEDTERCHTDQRGVP